MGKIKASIADVSTKFVPISPGQYELKIVEVTEVESDDGRLRYDIKLKVDEQGEEYGKSVTDRISMHKRDGTPNEYGAIQLKRYFEAVLGEDEVARRGDDLDTDELKHQRILGEIVIEPYEVDLPGGRKEQRQSNRISAIASLD